MAFSCSRKRQRSNGKEEEDDEQPPTKKIRCDNIPSFDSESSEMDVDDVTKEIIEKYPSYNDVSSVNSSSYESNEIHNEDDDGDAFEFEIDSSDQISKYSDDDAFEFEIDSSDEISEYNDSDSEDVSETDEDVSENNEEIVSQSDADKASYHERWIKYKKRGPGRPRKRGAKRRYTDGYGNQNDRRNKRRKEERHQIPWSEEVWKNKLFKPIKNNNFIYRRNWDEFNEKDDIFKESDIGEMDNECPECHALLFKHELRKRSDQRYYMCCKHGKIEEGWIKPMRKLPLDVKTLFTGQTELAKFFQQNIYLINSALRLGASKMKCKRTAGRGARKFILSGEVIHKTPDFKSIYDENKFNECRIYTYDPEEQLEHRLKLGFLNTIKSNPKTKRILAKLQTILMKHNYLIQQYQNVYNTYIKPHNAKTIPEFCIRIHRNVNPGLEEHKKRYESPSSNNKIATMVQINDDDEYKISHREIILTNIKYDKNKKLCTRRIHEGSAPLDAVVFPVFHIFAEDGYCFDMKGQYGISMRDFYRYRLMVRRIQGKIEWNPFHYGRRLFEAYTTNQYAKIQQTEMNQRKRIQKVELFFG